MSLWFVVWMLGRSPGKMGFKYSAAQLPCEHVSSDKGRATTSTVHLRGVNSKKSYLEPCIFLKKG